MATDYKDISASELAYLNSQLDKFQLHTRPSIYALIKEARSIKAAGKSIFDINAYAVTEMDDNFVIRKRLIFVVK